MVTHVLVVTLLEPLKDQLEVLLLGLVVRSPKGQAFRPIPSLAGFTALKTLTLDTKSIPPPKFDVLAASKIAGNSDQAPDKMKELEETFTENSKGFLVDILPRRSLESLQIGVESGTLDGPLCELAWRSKLGEFPKLKYVRMIGNVYHDLTAFCKEPDQEGRYHNLERYVPEKHRSKARVAVCGDSRMMEVETRSFFQQAGVVLDRLAVTWRASAGEDGHLNNGLMVVFTRPCVGGCKIKKCQDPKQWYNRPPVDH